ncbi:MAG: sensor histidine kinase [Sulfuricella denitrificans]|nr:sensor histidine kinase [Sulfuricella denitrificans]
MFGYDAPLAVSSGGNLRRILLLRGLLIGALLLAGFVAVRLLGLPLPLPPLLSVVGLLVLVSLLTWWRLQKPWPVTDGELFAQLLADVFAITVLLFYAGGSTNPLVSYYLVPLVIAAITLPGMYTWSMAVFTAACYTLLMFNYYPLMPRDGNFSTAVYLHLTGMWMTFVLSAFLIAFFVVRMANAVKERDRALAAAREDTLRNERIVALGTMAAGAAHELGTPLATMAVVTTELQQEYASDTALVEDLHLLRQQVDNCKEILSNMLVVAGQGRAEDATAQSLDHYFADLLEKWQLLRPGVAVESSWQGALPAPRIVADQTLTQALINLLNNAADASPDNVEIFGSWQHDELQLEIRDRGPGLSPDVQQRAGQPFFTTKGHGFGIGLFLANATIERFGGRVLLINREGGGVLTQIFLPLTKLLINS